MRKLLTVLGLLSLAAGAHRLDAQQAVAAAQGVSAGGAVAGGLRPGDLLRLRIWREQDLSGDFPVDESGVVTLPKLGPVRLDTVPTDSLRTRLVRAYQVYLNNPSVEITILRRISMLGAVQKPGLYPVDPTMTVSDALALAGGASAEGKVNQVELRRNGSRLVARLEQGGRLGDLQIQSGDQLYVPQKSWVSRNPWIVSSVIGTVATVTSILITR